MAKSSIHIEAGHGGFLAHNDRSQKTVNSIFFDEKNEVWNRKKEAFKIYRNELAARSDAYQKRTGQKIQKKAITHLSAIVNLNKNHDMQDMAKVCEYLEKTLDTKVFQIAIHRDEGHFNINGEAVKNYHAHIEFMGLDNEGKSVRKKLTKRYLGDLQSKVAELLEMERGINYAKEQKKRPKRLGTYQYKAHKKAEAEAKKKLLDTVKKKYIEPQIATIKNLKAEIKKLREELQGKGAERRDYARLEELNRDLVSEIKAKDLTIQELKNKVDEYRESNQKAVYDNPAYRKLEAENQDFKNEVKRLRDEISQINFDKLRDAEYREHEQNYPLMP